MFYNVLIRQGSSFCSRARLNSQTFALRDIKTAARENGRVGQKMIEFSLNCLRTEQFLY